MSTSPASPLPFYQWPSDISYSDAHATTTSRGSRIAATFVGDHRATRLQTLRESGQLRLRTLRGVPCEALIVNTAGGIVEGDDLSITIGVKGAGASVTIGSTAAEKCYRNPAATSKVGIELDVADASRLHWLPQESILFDGARLRRSLVVDLSLSADFIALEAVVFGRVARGEVMMNGMLRDSWRIRRAGRLVFADESLIATPIQDKLERHGVGDGAKAVAMLVATRGEDALDPLRAILAQHSIGDIAISGGVTARDGLVIMRMLSRSPQRLRECSHAIVSFMRQGDLPQSYA